MATPLGKKGACQPRKTETLLRFVMVTVSESGTEYFKNVDDIVRITVK